MTETLIQRIARHEGLRLTPYVDTTGNWTIGYGHKITECEAQSYVNGISEDTADDMLANDITKAQAELSEALPWTSELSNIRWQVLVEMVFQMGIAGLLTFATLLRYARQGNDEGVAHSMLGSLWHEQTPARCEELANLWLNETTA